MSQATMFVAALLYLVSKMGGAHLTRASRELTVRAFVSWARHAGFTHLREAGDVRGKHLRLYIASRLAQGIRPRTLCNEMAHLRCILRAAKCASVANAQELTNAKLGISGESRAGSRKALSKEELGRARALALSQNRPGMAAILGLQWVFGLRSNEGIHAQSDTLARWLVELDQGFVTVLAGTKGGKLRRVQFIDKQEAELVIREALEVAQRQNGFLVVRANGKPSGGLEQARSIYHAWCHRAGIQPHGARYAYARNLLDALVKKGHTEREALIAVSLSLGHGDGRGRYIRLVYGQGLSSRPLKADTRP